MEDMKNTNRKRDNIKYVGVDPQTLRGMRNLATAIITQAFSDAARKPSRSNNSSGAISAVEVSMSRSFLLGSSKDWRESLDIISSIAQLEPEYVIRLAKQTPWYKDGDTQLKGKA